MTFALGIGLALFGVLCGLSVAPSHSETEALRKQVERLTDVVKVMNAKPAF